MYVAQRDVIDRCHRILLHILQVHTIQIYSGITSCRVLDGELLHTKILEVNFIAFAYRLFYEDFSSIDGSKNKQSVGKCKIEEKSS